MRVLVDRSPAWLEPAEEFADQVVQVAFDNALDAARAIKKLEDAPIGRTSRERASADRASLDTRYWQAVRDLM